MCGEVQGRVHELLRVHALQVVLDYDTLAGSGFSGKEDVVPTFRQLVQDVLELNCVCSRNQNVEIGKPLLELVLCDELHPWTELFLAEITVVVIHLSLEREP